MMKLFSKNSNLCDHNSPTLQTDRQTDRRHAIAIPRFAVCTKVHRAIKTDTDGIMAHLLIPRFWIFIHSDFFHRDSPDPDPDPWNQYPCTFGIVMTLSNQKNRDPCIIATARQFPSQTTELSRTRTCCGAATQPITVKPQFGDDSTNGLACKLQRNYSVRHRLFFKINALVAHYKHMRLHWFYNDAVHCQQ